MAQDSPHTPRLLLAVLVIQGKRRKPLYNRINRKRADSCPQLKKGTTRVWVEKVVVVSEIWDNQKYIYAPPPPNVHVLYITLPNNVY